MLLHIPKHAEFKGFIATEEHRETEINLPIMSGSKLHFVFYWAINSYFFYYILAQSCMFLIFDRSKSGDFVSVYISYC